MGYVNDGRSGDCKSLVSATIVRFYYAPPNKTGVRQESVAPACEAGIRYVQFVYS